MDFEHFLFLCRHQGELKGLYLLQRKQAKKERRNYIPRPRNKIEKDLGI
jgi:hypothetical protein